VHRPLAEKDRVALAVLITLVDQYLCRWRYIRLGSTNCDYSSLEECLATVRALGGILPAEIHSPGRPTGPPPGAGIRPTRQGAIGALIPPASAQRRRSVTRRNRIRGHDPLVTSVTRSWSLRSRAAAASSRGGFSRVTIKEDGRS